MKASELMIGDLVAYNGNDVSIFSIEHFGGLVGIENEKVCDLIADKELTPIPLTKEILKANGFIVNTQQAYLIDGIFLDTGLDGNAYWWQIGHCPICAINYVHELQHALRLCGLNELADNFKIQKD